MSEERVTMVHGSQYTLEDIKGEVSFGSNPSCSHWASPVSGKKDRVVYTNYPCYAPFSSTPIEMRTSLYIGLDTPLLLQNGLCLGGPARTVSAFLDIEGGCQRWMEWLCERSPHNEAIIQGQRWGYKRFVEMDVGAVGHLVHHAACALRIHQEHHLVPLYWMVYTHAGMEEDLAYLLALMTSADGGKRIKPSMLVSHSALSTQVVGCLAGFLLRMYNREADSWKDNSRYGGHGSMWDDGREDAASQKIFNTALLFRKPDPKAVKSASVFDLPPTGSYPLTRDGVEKFVEVAGVEMPKLLRVKSIDNPNPTGVKYEKA